MNLLSTLYTQVVGGNSLRDQVAIVTGGTGELGSRVALRLGQMGASVAVVHRGQRKDAACELLTQLAEVGAKAVEVVRPALITGADVAVVFDEVSTSLGGVDIVVHTPGMAIKKPFTETSDEEFERNLDANVRTAFYVLREAARRVTDQGRIITLSTSITAVTIPFYGCYAGHKAATEHYVRALAKELGPRGVTVNAVAPGPIDSPFHFAAEAEEPTRLASTLDGADRLGDWDEIVPVIAFLCTPDAQWITAQTIRVNGGMA